jgi:hypothetical protein
MSSFFDPKDRLNHMAESGMAVPDLSKLLSPEDVAKEATKIPTAIGVEFNYITWAWYVEENPEDKSQSRLRFTISCPLLPFIKFQVPLDFEGMDIFITQAKEAMDRLLEVISPDEESETSTAENL